MIGRKAVVAARRAHRGGSGRRGRGVPHLLADRPAAQPAGARHARHPDLPRILEQLPLAPRRGDHGGQVHAAGAVVVVLPVLLVFLLLQRYFLRGIATTGLK